MVTSDAMKMTTTCSVMIGHLVDIISYHTDPSKFKSWKPSRAALTGISRGVEDSNQKKLCGRGMDIF